MRVKIQDLGPAVMDILSEYGEEITAKTPRVIDEVAIKAGENVKQAISAAGIGGTKYRNSISVKITRGRLMSSATIYSPKHYQLTHLLEHGHRLVRCGKVVGVTRAFPHWKPAEEAAIRELEQKLIEAVKK